MPASVRELVLHGHQVIVETAPARGSASTTRPTARPGPRSPPAPNLRRGRDGGEGEGAAAAEMPAAARGPDPVHLPALAADLPQTEALLQSGCVAIAYETVTDRRGRLPLLAPMSEVAGRMSVQVGAHCWRRCRAAPACCSAACPGVPPAKVVVVGGGVRAPTPSAWRWAWRPSVYVIDKSLERLYELDLQFGADAEHHLLAPSTPSSSRSSPPIS